MADPDKDSITPFVAVMVFMLGISMHLFSSFFVLPISPSPSLPSPPLLPSPALPSRPSLYLPANCYLRYNTTLLLQKNEVVVNIM